MITVFLPRLLDLGIGVISLGVIVFRLKRPKGSISERDLLQMIEERDNVITQLKLEIQAWQMHHEQLTNK